MFGVMKKVKLVVYCFFLFAVAGILVSVFPILHTIMIICFIPAGIVVFGILLVITAFNGLNKAFGGK